MTLSLCLIVKPTNEEAKLLDKCLESIYKWVDEICITITGKNEKVEKIAKKYKAKISYFEWIDDFAKARNFNFSQATNDWIMWCDTDDEVRGGGNLEKILEVMDEHGVDTGIADYLYDFDEFGNCTVKHRKTRIVKNDGCIKWMGKLHEDLIGQRDIKAYLIKDLKIIHKATTKRKQEAQKRNLDIALKQLEGDEDPKNIWDVANAYLSLGKHLDAIKYYSEFIPKSGSDEEKFLAWHRMAGALMTLEEYDKGIEAEFRAMKIRPWYPDAYLGLGEIYYKKGKPKHAKEFLIQGMAKEVPEDTAIVWNPRDYDFNPLMLLARVYYELSRPEEAKKCLKECLKLYPKHKGIKNSVNILETEIAKLRKIDEICEKIKKVKTKEEIKKLIDSAPDELKCHPKLVHLKNIHFIKTESTGKDLVIYCYQTDEAFDPDIIQKEGRGGSEEAVYHMSKRLADLGWNVVVYANCGFREKTFGKVIWKPWWSFNPRDKQDILIVWRHPAVFEIKEINAVKKYVWLHDIMKAQEFTVRRLSVLDKIFPLSKWQRNLFPNIPDEKFMITGNGIEPKQFEKKTKRNQYRMIYSSSYDRGLKCLLRMFPIIKKAVPQAELHIFYGWHTWKAMYPDNPEMVKEREEISQLLNQPGVYEHGRVSQEQIIDEYLKSNIWVYPTEFGEISCISAIKAQACGTIPITTNVAALDETVQFGLKVDSSTIYSDENAQQEWMNTTINLLQNPPTEKERKEMREWARKKFDWDLIANQWNLEFLKEKVLFKEEIITIGKFQWVRNQCSRDEKIVDIGGNKGDTFGGWDRKTITTVDIDLYDIENFIRADAHKLPFENNTFDTAILAEILEHVDDPVQVLKEAKRVANKIVITVPNEYEFASHLKPFMPAEEAAKEQGLTIEEMAKRDNPAVELYSKDNYRHLHHQRYYTRKILEEHFKKAGIKDYKIAKLYDSGFAFWVAICQVHS